MIVTLTGPSGVGKGYLTTKLQYEFSAKIVPWTTTRQPREDDGTIGNRRFVSRDEFTRMRTHGLLVGVQELHGEQYGLERKFLNPVKQGQLRVCEVNSANILEMFPFIQRRFSVALVTNDYERLRDRIIRRDPATNKIQLENRLETAVGEVELIKAHSSRFHLMVNIDLFPETEIAPVVIEAIKKGVDS